MALSPAPSAPSLPVLPPPSSYKPRQRITQVTHPHDIHLTLNVGAENAGTGLGMSPIARSLAKERRTCKSFNGEVVWPPKVEAALVEGKQSAASTTLTHATQLSRRSSQVRSKIALRKQICSPIGTNFARRSSAKRQASSAVLARSAVASRC
jgi:hypothetical protein